MRSQWGWGLCHPQTDLAHCCFKTDASHVSHPQQKQPKRPEQSQEGGSRSQSPPSAMCPSLATLLTPPANAAAEGKAVDGPVCKFLHRSMFVLQLCLPVDTQPGVMPQFPTALGVPWLPGATEEAEPGSRGLADRERQAAHAARD